MSAFSDWQCTIKGDACRKAQVALALYEERLAYRESLDEKRLAEVAQKHLASAQTDLENAKQTLALALENMRAAGCDEASLAEVEPTIQAAEAVEAKA